MLNKLDEDLETAIISIVSKKIAPLIGLEIDLPHEVIIFNMKNLINKGRLKIGFTIEDDLICALSFISASKISRNLYKSIDSGVEVSIEPNTPKIFKISTSQYAKIIKKAKDINLIPIH